jgi:hypothetical protein
MAIDELLISRIVVVAEFYTLPIVDSPILATIVCD